MGAVVRASRFTNFALVLLVRAFDGTSATTDARFDASVSGASEVARLSEMWLHIKCERNTWSLGGLSDIYVDHT